MHAWLSKWFLMSISNVILINWQLRIHTWSKIKSTQHSVPSAHAKAIKIPACLSIDVNTIRSRWACNPHDFLSLVELFVLLSVIKLLYKQGCLDSTTKEVQTWLNCKNTSMLLLLLLPRLNHIPAPTVPVRGLGRIFDVPSSPNNNTNSSCEFSPLSTSSESGSFFDPLNLDELNLPELLNSVKHLSNTTWHILHSEGSSVAIILPPTMEECERFDRASLMICLERLEEKGGISAVLVAIKPKEKMLQKSLHFLGFVDVTASDSLTEKLTSLDYKLLITHFFPDEE